MDINALTEEVIGAAIEVHRQLGPGLLESTYLQCLCRELSLRNISFEIEVPLPVRYKGMLLDCGYPIDLLVDGRLILELKSVEKLLPLHEAQLLTYLKLGGWQIGLLMNFNVEVLRLGLKRIVNNLVEGASASSAPLR
jgi:GxxExxY protein